jgi:hypothetical protein
MKNSLRIRFWYTVVSSPLEKELRVDRFRHSPILYLRPRTSPTTLREIRAYYYSLSVSAFSMMSRRRDSDAITSTAFPEFH